MKLYSFALLAAISVGVTTQPFSCFPRMKSTPSIKTYEREMPEAPRDTQPFAQDTPSPTKINVAKLTANPVQPTPANLKLGEIYYGYYCQQCHGVSGRGNGTVGHSYVPEALALTTPKVQALSDPQLASAMVQGTGHDPVLASIVPPERRWYLVTYLRNLAREPDH